MIFINDEFKKIYELLKDNKIHTSKEICEKIKKSDKTTRNIMKEFKRYLLNNNIDLVIKRGVGYLLPKKMEIPIVVENNEIPITRKERIDYLIEKLVVENKRIKIDEEARNIFSSVNTLSLDIKELKNKLKKYNLHFLSKPYYGIKVEKLELNIRNFLINYYYDSLDDSNDKRYKDIAECTKRFIYQENLKISDVSFLYIVNVVYVWIKRLESNNFLENYKEVFSENIEKVKKYINYLFNKLGINLNINDSEINYLTVIFSGKESLIYDNEEKISNLLRDIIKQIDITFNMNSQFNEILYNHLYDHFYSLLIRLKFNMETKNPLLEDIKKNMPLSFQKAKYMCNILEDKMNKKISEDEIAYLTVIFEMCIKEEKNKKNNILIVCPTGRCTSKFLKYMYNNLFGKYINKVDICSKLELEIKNLDLYDCIFSICEIEGKYSKEIYQVSPFLNYEEKFKIEKLLKNNEKKRLNLFEKELFFHIKDKKSKNEILEFLSLKIQKRMNSDFDMFSSVLKREELKYTEMFNGVAIPHPIGNGYGFKKIAVAILDEPIIWEKNYTDLIFLICIDKINDDTDQEYLLISSFIQKRENIERLKKEVNFERFIEILKGENNDK